MERQSPQNARRRRRTQGGSVLLIVLLLSTALALLTTSVLHGARQTVAISRAGQDSLQAELLVDSALEFARLRLRNDPDWPGTDADGFALGPDGESLCALRTSEDPLVFEMTGAFGGAEACLQADFEMEYVNPVAGAGLFMMGGGVGHLVHGTIDGNVILGDMPGSVLDYQNDGGEDTWTPTEADGRFILNVLRLEGDIYCWDESEKYLDVANNIGDEVHVGGDPFEMPKWNLERFLDSGPDRIHVNCVKTTFENRIIEETVVLMMMPGQEVRIVDAELRGGLVLYESNNADLREVDNPVRIIIENSKIGGGQHGVAPGIGVIAPSGRIEGGDFTTTGFNFWNSGWGLHDLTVDGQLFVVNEFRNIINAAFTFNPDAVGELSDFGIEMDTSKFVNMQTVREYYAPN